MRGANDVGLYDIKPPRDTLLRQVGTCGLLEPFLLLFSESYLRPRTALYVVYHYFRDSTSGIRSLQDSVDCDHCGDRDIRYVRIINYC